MMLEKLPISVSKSNIDKLLYCTELSDLIKESTQKNYVVLNSPTGNFFYDEWQIADPYKNTIIESILSELKTPGEARVIALPPGKAYRSHADIDDRYHLTLSAEKSYLIDLQKDQMYKTEVDGYWYLMDTGIVHSAVNFGSIIRLQLVVRKLLPKNTIDNSIKVFMQPSGKGRKEKLRYIFDETISPWLNSAHKKKIIGSVNITKQNTNVEFLIDAKYIDNLKSNLPTEIEATFYD